MRDSLVYYRSFLESTEFMTDEEYGRFTRAILNYGLNDTASDFKGIEKSLFALIKPILDAGKKHYEDGKKGGAPKGNQNARKKQGGLNEENKGGCFEGCSDKTTNKNSNKTSNKTSNNHDDVKYTDVKQKIQDVLNEGQELQPYYLKYIDKWIADYGEDFVSETVDRLDDKSRSMTGLMLTVIQRAKQEGLNE